MKICWVTDIAFNDQKLIKWNFGNVLKEINKSKEAQCLFISIKDKNYLNIVFNSDFIIYYRCCTNQLPVIQELQKRGIKVGYSIDDCLWIPGLLFYNEIFAKLIKAYFNQVDFIVSINKCMSNLINLQKPFIYKNTALSKNELNKYEIKHSNKIKIVMIAFDPQIKYVQNVISLLDRYNNKFQFIYFGDKNLFYAKNIELIRYPRTINKMEEFYFQLASLSPNILLSIYEENDFGHCKGLIKLFESSMFEIPLISSRLYSLIENLEDYKNVLFASSPQEFVDKIIWVIEHSIECKQIVENAKQHILENHTTEIRGKQFIKDLNVLS